MATETATDTKAVVEGKVPSSTIAMKHFHIFGHGISFSMSPAIHGAAFQHYGLPHTYDIRETKDIDDVEDLIKDPSFGGASVTMPHKLVVHQFCDTQTEHARQIGAINTLIIHEKAEDRIRRIVGDNTDWSGLHSIIAKYEKAQGKQSKVGLVIGAGGAARGAVYAMHQAGLKDIYISNRTSAKAEAVAEKFQNTIQIKVTPSLSALPEAPEVIISCVPAATTCEEQFIHLFSRNRGLCIDMSYQPRFTPLLAVAEQQDGWQRADGVEVLLCQAFTQFELWTGLSAPEQVMREALVAHGRKSRREYGQN